MLDVIALVAKPRQKVVASIKVIDIIFFIAEGLHVYREISNLVDGKQKGAFSPFIIIFKFNQP
ncbi:hypothetical protein COR50_18840 [Chitinophaga caeni]|uniref:Uncharacterized protein n=1 Tax=Chitinophaga caeni TaxID=2029983 RepID=A0A291QYN3_9BACT|nr:hypothetical protein COR50_18840 [Chitinophaga caeni]